MSDPIIDALRAGAAREDPAAQYRLAAALARTGEPVQAAGWLRKAADAGYPDALYTLATRRADRSANLPGVVGELRRAMAAGSAPAARLLGGVLARGWGLEADRAGAADAAIRAAGDLEGEARPEDGPGSSALAVASLVADGADGASMAGPLLVRASRAGCPLGAAVRLRRFVCGGDDDRAELEPMLVRLEAARYPNARSLRLRFARRATTGAGRAPAGAVDRDRLRASLAAPVSRHGRRETLCDAPSAAVVRALAPPEACEYLIAAASRLLAPSHVFDPATGKARADMYRTSLTAVIGPSDLDLAIASIGEGIAAAAGVPHSHAEFLSVLMYAPGQEYRPHFDWLPDGDDLARAGQRTTTALLYLNDEYEGGETSFTEARLAFRGDLGDLLIFRNVDADGRPDASSRHAGLPVRSGEKWIVSQWCRERPFDF